jgi:3-phosphoshikimate 1-carboxyvinyltransferase
VGLNPTRTAVLDVFREMGANIEVNADGEKCNEPVGSLRIRGGFDGLRNPLVISGRRIAEIIDEIPILAVCGTRTTGGIEFRNADELRVKESDRIASVVTNLRRMGADVEEFADGFRVGPSALSGAAVDSFGDHRIAMAFAVAGLFATDATEITGAECVTVSFPQFFGVLADLTRT